MTPELVLTIFRETLQLLIVLVMIVLIPALIVGLTVAMFQAATQINEMTLSFIPKLLVTLTVLMMAGPLMLRMLLEFTMRLYNNIVFFVG